MSPSLACSVLASASPVVVEAPAVPTAVPLLKRRHVVGFVLHEVAADRLVAVKAYRTSVEHFDARVQLLGVGCQLAWTCTLRSQQHSLSTSRARGGGGEGVGAYGVCASSHCS